VAQYQARRPLRIKGRIARARREGRRHGYGVEFVELGRQHAAGIRRCIEYFNLDAGHAGSRAPQACHVIILK
jgi:hypothetical protein